MIESTPVRPATDRRTMFDCRQAFAEQLAALARVDERVVAVCNDSVGSSNLAGFRDEFPDRLVNVGIAEQNMVGVAAGLANGGLLPFVCAAAPFLTGRALEQIKADIAYADRHVVLCGMSPGVAYGQLGPTHHSIEDLSWLRAIANLPIVVPADPAQTRAAVRWAASADGPSYLRIPRSPVPDLFGPETTLEPGRFVPLTEGDDVTLVAAGTLVWRAVEAATLLRHEGVSARVLAAPFVEPLDEAAVIAAARETRGIVSVEEATVSGGLGAAVAGVAGRYCPTRVRVLGVPGVFAPTGDVEFLLRYFGLTATGIADAARAVLADAAR